MADKMHTVRTPDGRLMNFVGPAEADEQTILAAAAQLYPQWKKRQDANLAASKNDPMVKEAEANRTGSFGENVLAGMGKRMTDYARGARQLVTFGGDAEKLREEAAQRAELDAPLMRTGGGMVGSAVTDLGTALVPGAAGVRAATLAKPMTQAAIGAGTGLLEESTSKGDALGNMARGAAFGAGGQAVGNRIAKAITPGAVTQEQQLAAELLQKYGLRVDPAEISDDILTKILRGIAGRELPGQVVSRANRPGVNTAVAGQLGANVDAGGSIMQGETKRLLEEALQQGYDPLKRVRQFNWTPQYERAIRSMGDTVDDPNALAAIERLSKRLDVPAIAGENFVKELRRVRGKGQTAARGARMGDATQGEMRDAYRTAETALEGLADANLKTTGQQALLDRFKGSRKQIAQLNTAENAMDEAGNVSARALAAELGGGAPLSGEMRDIARGATQFPGAFREGVGAVPGSNALLTNVGAVAGASAGDGGHSLLAAGIPWIREPVARMMTSPAYLKHWANPATSIGGKVNRAVTSPETAMLGEYLRRMSGPGALTLDEPMMDLRANRELY